MQSGLLRILIADDHPLVGEGLAAALAARLPNTVADCAGTIADAVALVRQNAYRLLLLDYHLPDANGFSGLFRLQHELGPVPIAVISASAPPSLVTAARAIGAAGFLSKAEPLDRLIVSIERLLRGERVFPPDPAADPQIGQLSERLATLSPAQMRVLAGLARGQLNKQIAADLELTEQTVKAHLTAVFRKLGVGNRLQAMLAVRTLLAPEE
jgi:DNA-binding NarL/FixJ family response regulator